ncbi:hypothetical protein WME91_54270 [Sorangium sp. So ce269]
MYPLGREVGAAVEQAGGAVQEPHTRGAIHRLLTAHPFEDELFERPETVFEGVSFLREGKAAVLSDDVEAALGRKPLRFEAWVRENLSAFGGAPGAV